MSKNTLRPRLPLHEQVLLLYGSFARLDDLFQMQARGTHRPSSAEFDEAVTVNQALALIVEDGLRLGGDDTRELHSQLLNSSLAPIAEIARSAAIKLSSRSGDAILD